MDRKFSELVQNELIDSDLDDAVQVLYKHIEQYHDTEGIEIETRLGFLDEHSFETDISLDFFNKIKRQLDTCNEFKKETRTYTDFFKNDLRLSVTQTTTGTDRICIKKKTLKKLSFRYENSPFDVRCSFSTEAPVELSDFPSNDIQKLYNRKKKRHSYIYRDYVRFDLTEVRTISNGLHTTTYEAEIEIFDIHKSPVSCPIWSSLDLLLKTRDLVDMCEPEDPEEERELVLVTDFGS